MWTDENRARYDRSKLRYLSDLTDEEWAHVAPLIPKAKRGGNKRTVDVRAVLNGLMYVLSSGCQWRYIPKDLPPRSTVNDYFRRWTTTAFFGRHTGFAAARDHPCGRHSGPRWRCAADEHALWAVSVPAEALCRWRLPGTAIPAGLEARLSRDQRRNRQAL